MKDISGRNNPPFGKFLSPFLTSDKSDFLEFASERRLRNLAMSIPSHGHHQLESTTQQCIRATIHATQDYLSEIVRGLSIANPDAARWLVVSSSGLDAIEWLNRTRDTQYGWIPTYPVTGHITCGKYLTPPHYGMTPAEPAITLSVNRCDDHGNADFFLTFSVSQAVEMRALLLIMNDLGGLWSTFENIFGVTAFTSIPLPDEVDSSEGTQWGCREYVEAFIEHVVDNPNNDDDCFETIDLEFALKENNPLYVPVVAAAALLRAFSFYFSSLHYKAKDKKNCRSEAKDLIISAIETGATNRYYIEKEAGE